MLNSLGKPQCPLGKVTSNDGTTYSIGLVRIKY